MIHNRTTGVDLHITYRWIVADQAAREAITTNPDGSVVTEDSGLYGKLLQTDLGIEYVCTSADPLVFTIVSGGASEETSIDAGTFPII